MKLSEKTTVKTLREMIGKKIRTRTSRALVEITDIELTKGETWFVGTEGSKKRRIKLEHISELVEDKSEARELKKQGIIERRLEQLERKEKKQEAEEVKKEAESNFPKTAPYPYESGEMGM
jgi:hypothetical protein